MKIWLIKRKGADYWGNYMPDWEIELQDGHRMYSQRCFYRKKDAVKYLNSKEYPYPEFYEVVGKV